VLLAPDHVADLGEERPLAEVVDDHVRHVGLDGVEQVAEEVVGHRPRRLDLLELQRDGLCFERPDDDGQPAVASHLPQNQRVGAATRRAGG
jgi:hypothetical protein